MENKPWVDGKSLSTSDLLTSKKRLHLRKTAVINFSLLVE